MNIYPVYFKGTLWTVEDCHPTFVIHYKNRSDYDVNRCVVLDKINNEYIHPNGQKENNK